MIQKPLLSVCLITYNHEKYIRETLDGIFIQQTNFPFEVIIADDFSRDNTRNIILEYQEKYPEIIQLIFQEKNVGPALNWLDLMHSPKGKYVAYLEGDDYWTNPLKLQKQVDFLEENPDYSICFHNIQEVDFESNIIQNSRLKSEETEKTYTLENLASGNLIYTPSVVFRKNYAELPSFIKYCPIGDYPLHLLNASFGLIKYFPEKMAAYRVGVGVWSSKSELFQIVNTLTTLKFLMMHFSSTPEITKILEQQYKMLLGKIEKILETTRDSGIPPEKLAYNLPIRKLGSIFLKKLKYSFLK